jgi:MTH538 TIR-like domain (DUF1863)
MVRRKCFISYHHADQTVVNQFINDFDHNHDCFIARGLGEEMPGDVINSSNTDYVMSKIRERFLGGSTVTIVFMGRCTWARRYVDWEIKLPSFGGFPSRFNDNLSTDWPKIDCYARHMDYPSSTQDLMEAIEAAYQRRVTHAHLIVNPRDRMVYNRSCP